MTGESEQQFQEVEIKLKLDERTYKELAALFPAERPPALQENTFFDTDKHTFMKSLWLLRMRKEDANYYLTTKGPAQKNDGGYIRPEYETQLTEEEVSAYIKGFKLSALPVLPVQEMQKRFGDLFVKPVFSFTNQRQFFKFDNWILELDRSVMKDQIFFELELETNLESLANCQQKLKDLFKAHGWVYEPSTEDKVRKAIRIFLGT